MAYEDFAELNDTDRLEQAERLINDPERMLEFLDAFAAWGMRVRRDILIYELYIKRYQGTDWDEFLERGGWSLSRDMSLADAHDMVLRLLRALAVPDNDDDGNQGNGGNQQNGAGDPGDPPLPPILV